MIITPHACRRFIERCMGEKDLYYTDKELNFAKKTLEHSVTPSLCNFLEGTRYRAIIDGFPDFRACFKVEDNEHILATVIFLEDKRNG
jgi:hypothetical protein